MCPSLLGEGQTEPPSPVTAQRSDAAGVVECVCPGCEGQTGGRINHGPTMQHLYSNAQPPSNNQLALRCISRPITISSRVQCIEKTQRWCGRLGLWSIAAPPLSSRDRRPPPPHLDAITGNEARSRVLDRLVKRSVLDTQDTLRLCVVIVVGAGVDRLDLGCITARVRRALGPVVLKRLCLVSSVAVGSSWQTSPGQSHWARRVRC